MAWGWEIGPPSPADLSAADAVLDAARVDRAA
jgi:hypothetical protein